jgi:hypothetical protein
MHDIEYAEEFETDTPFSEAEEMEYAANLLEITDEGELDQFLGSLLNKASQAVGSALKSPVGRALGGYLKGAIKQALPGIGAAVGGYFAPGAGADVGRRLATSAGQMLGLELEGLSPEDQEFEIARRLVRLVGAASQKAAQVAPGVDIQGAVKQGLLAAARKHAPGLLRKGTSLASWFKENAGEMAEPEADTPFGEAEELELAGQLLEVSDEGELDQFIGDLLKKASQAVGAVLKTPVGRALGGYVKGAIKKALPAIGSAIGGFAVPGAGAAIGGQLASRAGQLLGLEQEGLGIEDQGFETAKQLVRFGGAAAQAAASMPATAAPEAVAKAAVAKAARRYAPGLLRSGADAGMTGKSTSSSRQSGRWVRQGRKILLLGI